MTSKFIIIFSLFSILLFCTCSISPDYKIDFCLNFTEGDECNYDQAVFPMHQRIYVKFSSTEALLDSLYIGNISTKKEDGTFESLGFKEFRPKDKTTYLKHNIPFDVFGGFGSYLVEFKDSKNNVLAKKEVHFATEKQ